MPTPLVDCEPSPPLSPFAAAAEALTPTPHDLADKSWETWLAAVAARYCSAPFAPHHRQFWEWCWAIEPGVRPRPFVGIWPRGGAKSTSAEMACVALAGRDRRRYGLYVCGTQDQADDHVGNVAAILESASVGESYPDLATRALGKYGNPKGWRRNRLRTASGFTLDAIGLDTASRGAKIDEDRPDLIVIDDIDKESDSLAVTEAKITTLTRALIPAGSHDVAILAIQNLVHPNSIFARLVDGRADFLARRIISGPIPALDGIAVDNIDGRWTITSGTPTWAGQGIAVCQDQIDDWGYSAFMAEAQHNVAAPAGGIYDHVVWRHTPWAKVPWGQLIRIVVWVDPAVTKSDESDACGIQADALAIDGTIYRLVSWERRATPLEALRKAIRVAKELGADTVGVETDQGGDTWESVFREAATAEGYSPRYGSAKAGEGHGSKVARSSRMLVDYDKGRIVHVTTPRGVSHSTLEAALRRFPKTKPLDLADAAYWSWHDLRGGSKAPAFEGRRGEGRGVASPGVTDGLYDMQF